MKEKKQFNEWFDEWGEWISVCYEDYKQDCIGTPPLTFKQYAFGLYLETKYSDSLALN